MNCGKPVRVAQTRCIVLKTQVPANKTWIVAVPVLQHHYVACKDKSHLFIFAFTFRYIGVALSVFRNSIFVIQNTEALGQNTYLVGSRLYAVNMFDINILHMITCSINQQARKV